MQRQSTVDSYNYDKSRMSSSENSSNSDGLAKKKRNRNKNLGIWTEKEEERILKYAIKVSEKEYLLSVSRDKAARDITLNQLENVSVFDATEEDFLNPLGFFDKLWEINANSTGIVKIIPPQKWIQKQKQNFENETRQRILNPTKKLISRKQTLCDLYTAKVSKFIPIFHSLKIIACYSNPQTGNYLFIFLLFLIYCVKFLLQIPKFLF